MRKSISEILNEVVGYKTVEEKASFLKKNDSVTLQTVLKNMYDPTVKCLLPEGAPPYKPSDAKESQGMLFTETRRLRIFYEGNGYDNLPAIKRENIFIQILEGVDSEDAKVLIDMKDQNKVKGLTANTINLAFENLITIKKKERKAKNGQNVSEE